MRAKIQFISCLIAGALLLFISTGNLFGQIQDDGKSKLDITIDRNGEKIRIDTLIDTSQLPLLFEELNEQMPALENMIENFSRSFDSDAFNQFFNQEGNGLFDFFMDENFENQLDNSLNDLFDQFNSGEFQDLFKDLENSLEDLNLENFNFDQFNFDNFDGNTFDFRSDRSPRSRAQLGVILSEKAIDGLTDITVNEVVKGSIAEKAGLLKGDKIIAVDGKRAEHINDISRAVQSKKDKEILNLRIERNGIPTNLEIEMDVPKPVSEKIKKV